MASYRVERRTSNGWKFVGVIESNYAYATELWRSIGARLGRVYRLKQEQ